VTDAFFAPAGDRFAATEHSRGPWSPEHLHGGPPSGLLARAIERVVPEGFACARFGVDLLRPVPFAPLAAAAQISRPGKTVLRATATLSTDREIAAATALFIRREEVPVPALPAVAAPPPPAASQPFVFPFFRDAVGYHMAMELRLASGIFWKGPTRMWMRPRIPLVPGEPLTPLQRVMVCADSGNGVAPVLDTAGFTFVNPDVSVALHREPLGEWLCLDARSTPEPNGIGLADTLLWDEHGPIGRGTQTLVVRAR
jgi:hypothetical protein